MTLRYEGRVALVTGAGSGMGRAIATLMAGEGGCVAALDVNRESVEATAKAIDSGKSRVIGIGADITNEDEVAAAMAEVESRFGGLDVVVNAAGVYRRASLETLSVTDWALVLDTNLKGTFLVCQKALPLLRKSKHASIVNISSTSAVSGSVAAPHYAAAKGGVVSLTVSLASILSSEGIRVNVVLPGPTRTGIYGPGVDSTPVWDAMASLVPLGRVADPEELARAVLFLGSDDASFVSGSSLLVDGGFLARNPLAKEK